MYNTHFYPSQKIDFNINDEPIIWKFNDKGIINIITVTFLFKYVNNQNINYSFFSFGYHNLFFHDINLYKYKEINSIRLVNKSSSLKLDIKKDEYYYIFLEINKKSSSENNKYYISSNWVFGNNSFNSKDILINSLLIDDELEFDNFFFNIGSKEPKEKINFNFRIENLTLFNRKLTLDEKLNLMNGGSNPLLFIDFANSLVFSQYFYNKTGNEFLGGINGNTINNEENDLFHDYSKISDSQIKKKLFIYTMRQFIKLPQEIIKYLNDFEVNNFIIYLKFSIILNNENKITNLNINYKLYNRQNKSGVNIKLEKINENNNDKIEFKISLIENLSNFKSIISNTETLNCEYIILKYVKIIHLNKFNIFLDFSFNKIIQKINFIQNNNEFLLTDNHYIGDYDGTKLETSYILLEMEEFMLGKGTYIEINNSNIKYDDIYLYCKNLINNKILRNNLNSCIQRNEIIGISTECEYQDKDNNCIFRLPDYFNNPINPLANTTFNILIPYRQIFNNIRFESSNLNLNNNINENFVVYIHSGSFNLMRNNIIIEIDINNNNIFGNIFEIEFQGIRYSNFVISKKNSNTIISIEITNNINLSYPYIRIFNLSGNHSFTINSIKLLEVYYSFINNKNEKFVGEKINDFYKIINKEPYAENSILIDNFRRIDDFLLKCNLNCNGCNGPNNNNCINCNINYLNYKGCNIKNANFCSNYSSNPSFCSDCIADKQKIVIDNNRVFCFECHSDCLKCDSICLSCSKECLNCNILKNNEDTNCNNCPMECFNCNENCNTCFGETKNDCYKCSDVNKKIKEDYPYNCINCSNSGILTNSRRQICSQCYFSCKNCFNSKKNSCTECFSGDILYENNECKKINNINKCEPGFVFKSKNISNYYEKNDKCIKCIEGCFSCKVNINQCDNCIFGFYKLNKICTRCNLDGNFINNKILDSNNQPICDLCHSSCKKCSSDLFYNCEMCYSNYYILNIEVNKYICSLCNEDGYYKQGIYSKKCNNNCLNCLNTYTCLNCKKFYLLDNIKKDCVINCRIGTFKFGNKCIKCHNKCFSCFNDDEFSCIKCNNKKYLDFITNKCVSCNNLNNFKKNNKCYLCHEECRTCNGINKNNCLSCKNELFLNENSNLCSIDCPDKTYKIKINNLNFCRDCYNGCVKCINSNKNSCLKCEDNLIYNKYTKSCNLICENGYFLSNNNNCEKCSKNCYFCENKNKCLKCNDKFYLLLNGYCNSCKKKGFYIFKNKCLKCSPNCWNCKNYDNCTKCESSKKLIYDKNINKYYCNLNCKKNKNFNKILNKCIKCKECNNCQIKNDYLCINCFKCKQQCKINFKFNETGLYLFNNNQNYKINATLVKFDNNKIINNFKILFNNYFFNIINNNDNINKLKFKLNVSSILKSRNCIYKYNKIFEIKKLYEKNCMIAYINYNNTNYNLDFKFNFKLNFFEFGDSFSYSINNSKEKIKYNIYNNRIILIKPYQLKLIFIPNYFKKKFSITFYFKNHIINNLTCKKFKYLSINYNIEFNKINFYQSGIEQKFNKLNKNIDNKIIINTLDKIKPIINTSKDIWTGTVYISSFFPNFLGILIRFFQIVYILDYINLLELNLGEYTNSILNYFKLDLKFYFELNKYLNISKNEMEKKLIKILYFNPKFKELEFIYLTNINIEVIILFIFILFEIIFLIILKNIDYFKRLNKIKKIKLVEKIKIKTSLKDNIKYNINFANKNNKSKRSLPSLKIIELKKNKENILLKIYNFLSVKVKFLKITFIGIIFPNLITTIFFYSKIIYNFNYKSDIILIIIFVFYYFLIIFYLKEIFKTYSYFKGFKEQKINNEYRDYFFIFKNKIKGNHNYALLFSLIRDILLIYFGSLINLNILIKIILFIIIQLFFLIIIINFKSKNDYRNVKWFKIQEIINFILIVDALILYFTKYELFQFIFIFSYLFLLFVTVLNLITEFFNFFYLKLDNLWLMIKKKFNKNNLNNN